MTGKMGTGKSTVSGILSDLIGTPVVDVDAVGHEVLKDPAVIAEVRDEFPPAVKGETIDRKALREIVFSDPDSLRKLEEIVHPRMIRMVRERVEGMGDAIVDCALLERMKLVDICDIVVTVVSSLEEAARRKGLSVEEMKRIWNLQGDVEPIGYILHNDGDMNSLKRKVEAMLGRFSIPFRSRGV